MSLLMSIGLVVQVLSAIALIVLVLLQHGKGADLGAAFGSGASGSIFGAAGSGSFLSKMTWIIGAVFFLSTIAITIGSGAFAHHNARQASDFGAIVQRLPGKDGLRHISQIANVHVDKVTDYLKEGQKVRVKVIEADEKGRVRLSMKALINDEKRAAQEGSDIQQA